MDFVEEEFNRIFNDTVFASPITQEDITYSGLNAYVSIDNINDFEEREEIDEILNYVHEKRRNLIYTINRYRLDKLHRYFKWIVYVSKLEHKGCCPLPTLKHEFPPDIASLLYQFLNPHKRNFNLCMEELRSWSKVCNQDDRLILPPQINFRTRVHGDVKQHMTERLNTLLKAIREIQTDSESETDDDDENEEDDDTDSSDSDSDDDSGWETEEEEEIFPQSKKQRTETDTE